MIDYLANTGRSFLGLAEKARITILDRRGYDIDVKVTGEQEIDGKKSSIYSLSSVGASNSKKKEGILSDNLKSEMSEMQKELDKHNMTRKTYIVGFNPSSLSISAIGGGRFAKNNYAQGGNTTSDFAKMDTRIQMDFKLYFDAHADRELTETKFMTVKPQVEAFIAALRDEKTREVEFSWGKMLYCGVMNMVDVTYTMFSAFGCPLRAEMNVSMLCVDSGLVAGEESSWAKHYEDAFSEDFDWRGRGQKITKITNNLINR